MKILASLVAFALLAGSASPQEKVIATQELLKRMTGPAERWDFTLVDARTAVEFGEAHIPGSINVAASRTSKRLPEVVKDRSRAVVFYCNGPNCTKTVKAAKSALAAGYTDVWEYKDGLPGWGKAGQKIEGKPLPAVDAAPLTPQSLQSLLAGPNPPALVDIRDVEEFDAFHIQGATSLPLDEIAARLARAVPAGRSIVVVDHAGHQAPVAARLLSSLGRKDLKRLDGGILRWQGDGLTVAQGQAK